MTSYRGLPASEEAEWPEAAVDLPRLRDGDSYEVMVRNLWRLLMSGATLPEARPIVLAHADVLVFPSPPPSYRRPSPPIDDRSEPSE